MSGKRFQARAKTVQRLGRDGLVERNMATGEEKRVSQRTADVSFGPDRAVEQAAGHRAALPRNGANNPALSSRRRKKRFMLPRSRSAYRILLCRTLPLCGWRWTHP